MPEQATRARRRRAGQQRWECQCSDPPILLAMYEPGGNVEIKLRDRHYQASGRVHATCPRCGARHVLDLRPAAESNAAYADAQLALPIPPDDDPHGG